MPGADGPHRGAPRGRAGLAAPAASKPQPERETIAAVATPAGRGGIGVVRVSGPASAAIAQALLGRLPAPRRATRCRFRDARGETIDEGLALYFPAPQSYTGEAVLELHGHGGPVVVQALLAACLDAGARPAQPGEFTRRAFLEGKLDLAQAEAVADLIDAASDAARRYAMRSLSGEFSQAVHALGDALTGLRALTEAMLDFPEEDVDALHRDDARTRLAGLCAALSDLRARCRQGSLLREGVHVVLAGRPNVGKSSLLNRLAREERAIVTEIAGTTRDALHAAIQIEGVPITLVDTAGLRASDDTVERIGVERARGELVRADVVLAVIEASDADGAATRALMDELPSEAACLRVINKIDLVPGLAAGAQAGDANAVYVSAKTGAGIDVLRERILQQVGWRASEEGLFLARERQLRALAAAAERLDAAGAQLDRWELFAEELRLAHDALGEVTGAVHADALLGEIFARFCIGK